MLREKGQMSISALYLAIGWTIFGENFVSKRLLREPSETGCFVYTDWCLFWLFNSCQPLASESQLAPTALKKKPRWKKKYDL